MMEYTVDQLVKSIEKDFGFKKELIENPVLRGMWCIDFEVNNIKYHGYTAYAGALPQLVVRGSTSEFYDNHDTPITEEYYNEFIKGRKIVLRHVIDRDTYDWEDTGVFFKSQQEAKEYISQLEKSEDYFYDFVD